MISSCTNYWDTMPCITVYANCNAKFAVNLNMFALNDNDELIFVIKNFDYIDSPYAVMFRTRKSDMNADGEVIFKITQEDTKKIHPGAFYNFTVALNAFDPKQETIYKRLTENGNILIKYGAQDLLIQQSDTEQTTGTEIVSARLEKIEG